MEENKEVLKVRMLGEFSMVYGEKILQIKRKTTSKVFQLLQILLYSGENGISRSRLLKYLFGCDAEGNLSANLRVIIYHLRKLLREMELPEEDYIRTVGGRFFFMSSFPVEVDILTFEKLIKEAEGQPEEEQLRILKEASCYREVFLPALAGEEWVVIAEAHHQRKYFECMEKLCILMKERGDYKELLEITAGAAAAYPFDEWQLCQMDCLIALNRLEEAMELYEKTASMYFEELAVAPSEGMLAYFRELSSRMRPDISGFDEIREFLRENKYIDGAYYCPLPSFLDIYRILSRNMARSGQSVYLLLCTLIDGKKKALKEKPGKQAADRLAETIREALRRGDVYTRYSKSQFLLLLTGIRQEELLIIMERLDSRFRKKEKTGQFWMSYRIASVAEL